MKALILFLFLTNMPSTRHAVVTNMDRLYTSIFQDYNRKTLPLLNSSDTVYVGLSAYVVNVNNFNEISGELSVTLAFIIQWQEQRISWNVSDFGGISSTTVCPEDIWRPQLYLLQSSDAVIDIGNTSLQPLIYSNGSVSWITSKVFKVSCSVDVLHFPFDTQTCELSLLNWALPLSSFVIYAQNTSLQEDYYNRNSQWDLKSGTLDSCTDLPPVPCLNLKLVLKRRSGFFIFYIVIPLAFLGLINNLVFIMPPSSGERTSVAVTTFLSFIVYMGTVNDIVPQSSDPIALIYYYIAFLLLYSCSTMFLCIIALRIYDRKTDVPSKLKFLIWIAGLYFLRKRSRGISDAPHTGKGLQSVNEDTTKDDVFELNDKDVGSLNGNNNYADIQRTISPSSAAQSEWNCTWKEVGKTFDAYCSVILYLSFIIVSIILGSRWGSA